MLRELDYRQSVEKMSADLQELGVSLWLSFKEGRDSKVWGRNKQARVLGRQWKGSKNTSKKQRPKGCRWRIRRLARGLVGNWSSNRIRTRRKRRVYRKGHRKIYKKSRK